MNLPRRLFAEAIGALFLTATVIGSGIMGARLAGGVEAVALLGNALATSGVLYVLITGLAPVSGAHFNPAVSLALALRGDLSVRDCLLYMLAQTAGCVMGALLAHAMFDLPLLQVATHTRAGGGRILSEVVAAFALVATILWIGRTRVEATPAAVAVIVGVSYWATASTGFANPAITIARSLTDTFAGVRPQDAPPFIVAQFLGALVAVGAFAWLYRDAPIFSADGDERQAGGVKAPLSARRRARPMP